MTPRKKRSGHKTAASKSGDGAAARQAPPPPAASRPPAVDGGVDPSESATGDAAGVAPSVETAEQARHFKTGAGAYEGGIYPYSEPITSPYRDRVDAGGPAYDDANGDFPWKQDWFPAKD